MKRKLDVFALKFVADILSLPIWWMSRFSRRDKNVWIFGAMSGNGYSDNSQAIFEYVSANRQDIKAVWITRSASVYESLKRKNLNAAICKTAECRYWCKKAGYAFFTTSIRDVDNRYINGCRQIWLWHGMTIKTIEHDRKVWISKKVVFKDFLRNNMPQNRKNPFAVISTAPFFNPMMSSAFQVPAKNVLVSGYPRNDVFFSRLKNRQIEDIDRKFGNPLKILYMPTFRDSITDANAGTFNPFGGYGFDEAKFANLLDDENIVFMYKGHYAEGKLLNICNNERFIVLDNTIKSDLYDLVKDVDVLMTDYSSIYFDFLLTKKPVILVPFDYEDYSQKSRSLYYDYNTHIEGVKAYNWGEVLDVIINRKYYVVSQATCNKFHLYQDASSSKRIVDKLISIGNGEL